MARGPTGLTTVLMGAMEIRAGAILSPCTHQQAFSSCNILMFTRISRGMAQARTGRQVCSCKISKVTIPRGTPCPESAIC